MLALHLEEIPLVLLGSIEQQILRLVEALRVGVGGLNLGLVRRIQLVRYVNQCAGVGSIQTGAFAFIVLAALLLIV